MLSPLREGEILHINKTSSPWTLADGPEVWAQFVQHLLPVVKQYLRPFSKLVLSVLYSLASMEMGEDVVTADPSVVKVMWEAVSLLVQRSLNMFVVICGVATKFLEGV